MSSDVRCGDWLPVSQLGTETKVEPFGPGLWCQRKTNPKSELTQCVTVISTLLLMYTYCYLLTYLVCIICAFMSLNTRAATPVVVHSPNLRSGARIASLSFGVCGLRLRGCPRLCPWSWWFTGVGRRAELVHAMMGVG